LRAVEKLKPSLVQKTTPRLTPDPSIALDAGQVAQLEDFWKRIYPPRLFNPVRLRTDYSGYPEIPQGFENILRTFVLAVVLLSLAAKIDRVSGSGTSSRISYAFGFTGMSNRIRLRPLRLRSMTSARFSNC